MAYNPNKDDMIKTFTLEKDGGTLDFQIFSYNHQAPKLQISRSFTRRDGTTDYGKGGRLSLDEVVFLKDNINEIIIAMEEASK